MKTLTSKLVIALLLPAFLIFGCNRNLKKDETGSKSISEEIVNKQDIKPEIEKMLYEFPTPFEITVMLNKAQAGFIFDLTNSSANIEKYMDEKAQAINIGVYSADLSYAAAYNRSDEISKLMECTGKLCDQLGISGIYNQNLVEIVKQNGNNQDSLVNILTQVFSKTKNYLSNTNRDKVTLFIASGGFIEALYIATNLNILTENNKEITRIIYLQKESLNKLLNVMDAFSQDQDVAKLYADMQDINTFLNSNPVAENQNLSNEKAVELKNKVEIIRTSLVK
jgi:hypothetical protein